MSKPDFHVFKMRDIGVTNKSIIVNPLALTPYVSELNLNRGDVIQIIYNNNRIPDNTIYIWDGYALTPVYNKWSVCDINEVGPDYFTDMGYFDLPSNLPVAPFKDNEDGFHISSVVLAGKEYLVRFKHNGTREWAINDGYAIMKYTYNMDNDEIIAEISYWKRN